MRIRFIVLTLFTTLAFTLSVSSKPSGSGLNFKLYLTSDHLLFCAMGGFLRAQSYSKENGDFVLSSDDKEIQKGNMVLYSHNGDLFLTTDETYGNHSVFKNGDTTFLFTDFIKKLKKPLIFDINSCIEKPITVIDYTKYVITKISRKYPIYEDSRCLEIIVNPSTPSFLNPLICSIETFARFLGYEVQLSKRKDLDGDERILKLKEDWEMAKTFGFSCCMDDSTAFEHIDRLLSNVKNENRHEKVKKK